MKLRFTKMHGCGNDYIYVNCFNQQINNIKELSVKLSDRHYGIGSDGIILICRSNTADAKMRMFNADGSEGKMCGNGIRCVGKYLYDNKMVNKKNITIETLSGIKKLYVYEINGEAKKLRVDMGKAELNSSKIPACFNKDKIINEPILIGNITYNITCVSIGNPHCVVFCDEPYKTDIEKIGPLFENNEIFPQKINTEFVKIVNDKTLKMRVFERGSGETWACGTGACAAAVAAVENGYCKKDEDITVKLRGGELVIKYTDDTVYMTGEAKKVYEGEVLI